MQINSHITPTRADRKQPVSQLPAQQDQHNSHINFGSGSPFNNTILQLLLQLIIQLLQQLSQQNPEPEPESLDLSQLQQDNLKQLMGFSPNAPVGVEVQDNDGSGTVSVGDTAIASGGITGGEISRRTLTADDVAQINQVAGNVPQSFTAAQQKWQNASGGADTLVSYTTQQSCFCPSEFTRPIAVTESNGEISRAVYTDTNEPVPDNIRQSLQTVDQRFEQLQAAYESGADLVNAEYDEQFGFPTSVFIDQSQMIADEEISYTITDLRIALP